jgi:hypothetical protein
MCPPSAARRVTRFGALLLSLFVIGSFALRDTTAPSAIAASRQQATAAGKTDETQARAVCGTCHAFPPPDLLPKSQWRDEFLRMKFIREKRQMPLVSRDALRLIPLPEDMEKVLPFFLSHAPEHLPLPAPWPDPAESSVKFRMRTLSADKINGAPAVSHVRLTDFDGDGHIDALVTEMQQGVLLYAPHVSAARELTVLASIPHPDHVAAVDLDKDGVQDLLVADLGEFPPFDHDHGAVIWLRGIGNGKFGAMWLDGWPRVADVESGDFNDDGKSDLVVAAFGYQTTGNISVLENKTSNYAQPQFTSHVIDPRHGSIHVIPADLNHDGHLDFVALLAQEYETVIVYINRGTRDFSFDQKVIYVAPHPNWGSSGIQLVDMDNDRDPDVLLTHGDTFDDGVVKPYHGIQWLENKGSYPFVDHRLADLPGVHRAVAVDLDGDGDLDVVAGALLAGGADVDEKILPAIVWLERTSATTFVKHTIEVGYPRHATLDAADIDGDGDIDIVAGNFAANRAVTGWVQIWENQLKQPATAANLSSPK